MLQATRLVAGVYANAATQTSPFNSPFSISPACSESLPTCVSTATDVPPTHRSSTSQQTDSGENVSSSQCMPVEEPSSAGVPSDLYANLSFSEPRRQSGVRTTNRAVSLPENFCKEDLSLLRSGLADASASAQSRVVSMPASLCMVELESGSPESDESISDIALGQLHTEGSGTADSSAPSTPKTVIVHSLTSDHFNTPSSPSSCDSVEFTLEDPELLPDTFLRRSTSPSVVVPEKNSNSVSLLEDDGWLTWANSPPRPIPALHGPSSLPYARCPSGAEGTVIEEQSAMSRVIWGLDHNDRPMASQSVTPQETKLLPKVSPSGALADSAFIHTPTADSVSVYPSTPTSISKHELDDLKSCRVEDFRNPRRASSVPGFSLEGTTGMIVRDRLREGTGLGFITANGQIPRGVMYEQNSRGGAVHSSQNRQSQTPDKMDPNIGSLLSSNENIERRATMQNWNESHDVKLQGESPGNQSNVIDLFPNALRIPAHNFNANTRISSSSQTSGDYPGHLPTPPNSSSPVWSSIFSPVKINHFPAANNYTYSMRGQSNLTPLSKMSATDEELSHELRRFVLENMSTSNLGLTAPSLRAPAIPQISTVPVYPLSHSKASFVDTPSLSPAISISHNMPFAQKSHLVDNVSTKAVLSQSLHSPNRPTSIYKRSTLSNPRSIPLSRLHQNQKRDPVKLATVPEEDLEISVQENRVVPPSSQNLSHISLSMPSTLEDQLQPQSIEERFVVENERTHGMILRVKLPNHGQVRAEVPRDMDPSQDASPRASSPKKRKLQRKRKSTISRTESARGFPLISEGTVSFGSNNVRNEQSAHDSV